MRIVTIVMVTHFKKVLVDFDYLGVLGTLTVVLRINSKRVEFVENDGSGAKED